MAYMSQEKKAQLAPAIKAVLKKFNMQGSIAVKHHTKLVANIQSGCLDLIGNYIGTVNEKRAASGDVLLTNPDHLTINHYFINECFGGECAEFLTELLTAMMVGNHNKSDVMTDYFDVGWYIDINIGKWNKPYLLR